MPLRLLTILAFLLLAALAWTVSSRHKSTLRKQREARYQTTLATYASAFTPGLTRAQVDDLLRTRNLSAEQVHLDGTSWDKLLKIGQEHSPRLSCSHDDIDIRLAFTPSGPTPETPASTDDKLLAVTLFRWSRNCL
jgi:hypothetical protein